jgi:hypothetical protein
MKLIILELPENLEKNYSVVQAFPVLSGSVKRKNCLLKKREAKKRRCGHENELLSEMKIFY